MEMGELTEIQQTFIDVPAMDKAFIGGRQTGQTTALCFDALINASQGDDVALTASRHSIRMRIMDKAADILRDSSVVQGSVKRVGSDEIDIPDGGRIQSLDSNYITTGRSDPDEYDHLAIDELDFFEPNRLDAILEAFRSEGATIAAVGTPRYPSPNISRLIEGDLEGGWYTVFDDPIGAEFVEDERVRALEETMSAEQIVSELRGMVVKDPSEQADFTRGDAD